MNDNMIFLCCTLGLVLLLSGCTAKDNNVRITANTPATAAVPVMKPRSEPIFYNGKTYNLDFEPEAGGSFAMKVSGMSARQQKDAVAVATSSLRYFACPDGKTGKLTNSPSYVENRWVMSARCG